MTRYPSGSQGPRSTAHSQGRAGRTKPSSPLLASQRKTVNCDESSPNGAARSIAVISRPRAEGTTKVNGPNDLASLFIGGLQETLALQCKEVYKSEIGCQLEIALRRKLGLNRSRESIMNKCSMINELRSTFRGGRMLATLALFVYAAGMLW